MYAVTHAFPLNEYKGHVVRIAGGVNSTKPAKNGRCLLDVSVFAPIFSCYLCSGEL